MKLTFILSNYKDAFDAAMHVDMNIERHLRERVVTITATPEQMESLDMKHNESIAKVIAELEAEND